MRKQLSNEVLDILAMAEVDENVVYLTCGQLERKTYQAVNQALESIGGKWNRKAQGHVYESDPSEQLETIILTGEIQPVQSFDFFPTPPDLAARVIELADIKHGMVVIEPSAGTGALADLCAEIVGIDNVPVVEIRDDLVAVLNSKGYNTWHSDFLDIEFWEWGDDTDRIVMNPPFSKQQDIDHVTHAWQFIKPGGRLVAIMSAGVTFRTNRKTRGFRELVERYGRIEQNPEGAFQPSGTKVRTVTVILDREL